MRFPWCTPYPYGVMSEDRAHVLYFDYNDVASLEAAVDRAGNDLAAIVVSAFRHDYGKHQELPDPAFAARARALCDANDAALILDDVRAGFRLTLHGSWDQIGVQPDLSAWSKAIANGYALSAVMGNDRFRERRRSSMPPVRSGAARPQWRPRSRPSTCCRPKMARSNAADGPAAARRHRRAGAAL